VTAFDAPIIDKLTVRERMLNRVSDEREVAIRLEAAISAALAALPQAEPVLWRYCNHDINGDPWPWSYTERRPEPGSYSEIEPLFASPTPAVSREDVIKECASSAAKFVPLRIRTDADRFQSKLAGDICCAIRALSSEPHHG
jgi:hypothetical protein